MAFLAIKSNPAIGFLWRFALIYGLLIVPWPGWDLFYGQYFRTFGQTAFSRDDSRRIIHFQAHRVEHGINALDSEMTLGNRDGIDSSGRGLSSTLSLDTRSIGWIPTALTIALILATPVPWRRRGWALFWGLLLVHGFILFTLQTWIWDASPGLSLSTLSPFWQEVADDLEYTFIIQLGASFSVPVLIWILVTFRLEDARSLTLTPGGSTRTPEGKATHTGK